VTWKSAYSKTVVDTLGVIRSRTTVAPRGGRTGVDGVPDVFTIIAQQLQNLLPTIVTQLGDVRNAIVNNGRGGCSYKEFLACNPRDFDANQKVKYAAGSLIGKALTWWNTQVQTRGRVAAIGMAGHAAYTDRFPHLVTHEKKRIKRMLTDEAVGTRDLKKNIKKRGNNGELSRDGKVKDDNKRSRTGRAFATTTSNPVKKEYSGTTPKCTTCNYHHQPEIPCHLCTNCNRLGNLAKDCRVGPRMVNPVNARNPTAD
ncbi:hypothetical protein Tco_0403761, partial [Tanacetum coccineum]